MLEQGLELDVLRGTPSEQRVPTLVYKKKKTKVARFVIKNNHLKDRSSVL